MLRDKRKERTMSLQPEPIPAVTEETVRVARAAFPNGNIYMQMRDSLVQNQRSKVE
jgi:transposase